MKQSTSTSCTGYLLMKDDKAIAKSRYLVYNMGEGTPRVISGQPSAAQIAFFGPGAGRTDLSNSGG